MKYLYLVVFFYPSVNAHPKINLVTHLDELTNKNQFSGIVLIAQNNSILLQKPFGLANHELDIKNQLSTKFRIASITKQFTAALILRLQELGYLSLNDTVSKFIPDYPNGSAMTLHHLLSHTSGLARIQEIPDLANILRIAHTRAQMVDLFKDSPAKFNPSEYYDYSNAGYLLLSYIIELATQKSFAQALKEFILTPAGMHESGSDDNAFILKDRASGYNLVNNELQNGAYIDMPLCSGSGGMYATAHDLYLWNQALYSGQIINRDSLALMLTPHTQTLTPFEGCIGWDLSYAQYGYGIRVGTSANGHHFTSHDGIINGFCSNIIHIFESSTDIIILSNLQHAPIKEMSDIIINYVSTSKIG